MKPMRITRTALLAILFLAGLLVLWNKFASQTSNVVDTSGHERGVRLEQVGLAEIRQKAAAKQPVSLSKHIQHRARQKGMLRLHDGSFIEPLNGAINPPVAHWQADRPYSPIIGKEKTVWPDIGELEFYVHADGSKTTTMMNDVSRKGVHKIEAITLVVHPHPKGMKPRTLGAAELGLQGGMNRGAKQATK